MSVSVCGCCCFSAGCVYFCKSLRVCVCDCVYFFVTRVIIFAQGLLALWFLLCKMPKNYLLLLLLWNEHWKWFNFLALPHCTCNTNKYLHFYVCMCVLCTLQLIYSIFNLIFVFVICLFDALMLLLRRVNGKTTRLRLTQRDHFTVKNFHSLRKIEMSDEHARERLNEWERDEACLQVCVCGCVCVYVLALF